MSCAVSVLSSALEAELARGADQGRRIGRRHARQHDQVGVAADHVGHDREEVGGAGLVGVRVGDHGEAQLLGRLDALLALVERVGLVAGDEGDRLHAAIVHQVLVDDRPGLVAGDHAQDRIGRRRRVERLRERVGEVEGAVLLGHRAHAGRRRVDVRADDVLDAVLLRQPLGAGHGQLGIVLVVDRDDLDLVLLAADVDAALGVVHVGGRFGAVLVGQAPGRGRAAHHAEHADLQDLLGSGRVRRQAPGSGQRCAQEQGATGLREHRH